MSIICDYCGQPAALVDSIMVYQHDHGKIWYCAACQAWVGVHKGTDEPLGRLADAQLRKYKRFAHRAFDPFWEGKDKSTRKAAYEWLSKEMGLPLEKTHIGMMDVDQCKEVIRICKEAKRHG